MTRKTPKKRDVYLYLYLKNDSFMHKWYTTEFYEHCEKRKSLRVCGVFIDYYDEGEMINIEDRINLNWMLYMLKGTKFLIHCESKEMISKDPDVLLEFETNVKSLGGSVYYLLDTAVLQAEKEFDIHKKKMANREAYNKSRLTYNF